MELVQVHGQQGQRKGLGELPVLQERRVRPQHHTHLGDLAVWTGGTYGHVGVVVSLNPTMIEDFNKAGTGVDALRKDAGANCYLHRT